MRQVIVFNKNWTFTKPGNAPIPVRLPHTWNAQDGQDGGNDYWRGTAVYEKEFFRPDWFGEIVLEFAGAAMSADVFVNGAQLAHHDGGYSTFRVNITDALVPGNNKVTVSVDNSENDRVYPQKADFTFYGGLWRPGKTAKARSRSVLAMRSIPPSRGMAMHLLHSPSRMCICGMG